MFADRGYNVLGVDEKEDIASEGEDEEEIVDNMGGVEGQRIGLPREEEVVRKLQDPKLPSQAEVDRHYLMGHMQYRNWCHVCVRSQGKDMNHFKDKAKERKFPEYSWDYCFPGDELGFRWTVLVGKERHQELDGSCGANERDEAWKVYSG